MSAAAARRAWSYSFSWWRTKHRFPFALATLTMAAAATGYWSISGIRFEVFDHAVFGLSGVGLVGDEDATLTFAYRAGHSRQASRPGNVPIAEYGGYFVDALVR